MKILVCTDGSEQSKKAMEEAAKIAGGCSVDEVTVIHTYERTQVFPMWDEGYHIAQEELERLRRMEAQDRRDEKEKLLQEAVDFFAGKNIKANKILVEGHPAETIAKIADEEGYDMLVVGSRGLGGLKKLMLGSVSNALLQEVSTNVLVVKQ